MKTSPADTFVAEGEKHLDAGEWAYAEAAFRRAVEVDPTSAAALSKLGVALIRQRRMGEAEQAFARAVGVDPKHAPAWSNLGNVYQEAGRTDEALAAYQRAIAADPDYWLAYENLAALYKKLGRTSEQIAAQKKATRLKLSARAPATRQGTAGSRGTAEGGRRLGCLGRAAVVLTLLGAAAYALRVVTAL